MNEEETPKANGTLNKINTKSEELNETIKSLLIYVGFAAATISAIAYVIITWVMVKGFTTNLQLANQITFAIIGAIVGVSITISLIMQGIAFAKRDENAQRIMTAYYKALNKTKKIKEMHTIDHYVKWAIIKTIVLRGFTVAITTFFILYIFIEGNGNYTLLGLAFANIFMFIGFGLVGLSNAYDFYLKQHILVIEELTVKLKEEQQDKETESIYTNKFDFAEAVEEFNKIEEEKEKGLTD